MKVRTAIRDPSICEGVFQPIEGVCAWARQNAAFKTAGLFVAAILLCLCSAAQAAAQPYSPIETPLRRFTLETAYGFASPSSLQTPSIVGRNFFLEASLGAKRFLDSPHSSTLIDFAYPHALAGYLGSLSADSASATTTAWRLGLGIKDGIGYKLDQAFVIPTVSSAWLLAVPSFGRLPVNPDEQSRVERLSGLRFSISTAAGLNVQLASAFAIDFGYEQTLVFPRFIFLQFVGTQALQTGLQMGAGYFIDAVFGGAPTLLPIAHVVLKSAINFTLYALRRERMFFPFDGAPPLLINTFKIGVAFYIGKIYD